MPFKRGAKPPVIDNKSFEPAISSDLPATNTNPHNRGGNPRPKHRRHLSKCKEAQEAFAANAKTYVAVHKAATRKALKSGSLAVALEGAEWALTHMPAAEDGTTIVTSSIDAKTSLRGSTDAHGVQILIGGFVPPEAPKQLTGTAVGPIINVSKVEPT